MNKTLRPLLGIAAVAFAAHASAQITFYEGEGFRGRTFAANGEVRNFERSGFNDRASSVVVERGRWEVCEDARFNGRCVVLRRGSYDSLRGMGMENRISSVRRVDERRNYDNEAPQALAAPNYEYRRRPDERLREVPITSARAVMGPPEQRCWVEREQVSQEQGRTNIPAAIAGAVIGGILGHQVGGGRGKDIATAGGAVGGAAVGANIGRGGGQAESRDVQRCESTPGQAKPDYWDVTYNFRGQEHRVQMTSSPGPTVMVNDRGEPRL